MGADANRRRISLGATLAKLPEPTAALLKRLRYTAVLLETVAEHAKTERAYNAARLGAKTIWQAMDRIEDFAGLIEDLAVAHEQRSRRLDRIRDSVTGYSATRPPPNRRRRRQ